MERAIWKNNEYDASAVMQDFVLETTIRNVSGRELFCPDPGCKKPLLKYCHGEKRGAYFAHIENEDCDYGNFDGRISPSVKKVRRILFEYLKKRGYDVAIEQKLLPHHYTHIILCMGDRRIAIEIGTQGSIARDIIDLERQYKEKNIVVQWIVLSENDVHKKETELSYLKRYCLNTSNYNDVLIVNEEGTRFTQIRLDRNDYSYSYYPIDLGQYKELYLDRGTLYNLSFENGELTLIDFNKRYTSWLANKKALFDSKVAAIKMREEKSATTHYEPFSPTEIKRRKGEYNTTHDEPFFLTENDEDFVWKTIDELKIGLSQHEKQVYDVHGDRWVRCSKCGKANKTDAFFEYGGPDRTTGICSECHRNLKNKRNFGG